MGDAEVPERCDKDITDDDALACFRAWENAGGPAVEESEVAAAPPVAASAEPEGLGVRRFDRSIDMAWRRTSYSGLIRAADVPLVSSEPEVVALDDETGNIPVAETAAGIGADVVSPMSELPAGATFGSLVHAVLETADPMAADLAAELEARVREHAVWWPVDVSPSDLAEAMVPMHDTPLGPLAKGMTLRQIGLPIDCGSWTSSSRWRVAISIGRGAIRWRTSAACSASIWVRATIRWSAMPTGYGRRVWMTSRCAGI